MPASVALPPLFPGSGRAEIAIFAGGLLILLGAVFGIAGALAMGRVRTIYPEPREGARLIRHGIFALVRHPIYTSLILLGFGWTMVWMSPTGLAAALVTLVFLDAKATDEERRLRRVYPDYDDYAEGVKKLLPWLY